MSTTTVGMAGDQLYLGKPVIAVPDYWTNPIIGFCVGYEGKQPIILDYLTMEEEVVEYRTFIYTEQRYQFIVKSDPFDLCSILYPEDCLENNFHDVKQEFLLKESDIRTRLYENGFWEKLIDYRAKNPVS